MLSGVSAHYTVEIPLTYTVHTLSVHGSQVRAQKEGSVPPKISGYEGYMPMISGDSGPWFKRGSTVLHSESRPL